TDYAMDLRVRCGRPASSPGYPARPRARGWGHGRHRDLRAQGHPAGNDLRAVPPARGIRTSPGASSAHPASAAQGPAVTGASGEQCPHLTGDLKVLTRPDHDNAGNRVRARNVAVGSKRPIRRRVDADTEVREPFACTQPDLRRI